MSDGNDRWEDVFSSTSRPEMGERPAPEEISVYTIENGERGRDDVIIIWDGNGWEKETAWIQAPERAVLDLSDYE